MRRALAVFLAFVAVSRAGEPPVMAVVESSLATGSVQIRQFAFDGNPDTYFASEKDAGKTDHFTVIFDKAVALKSVIATTGKPAGGDALDTGMLEGSADGTKFEPLAQFASGVAKASPAGKTVKALRIKPTDDIKHPLVIREIAVESDPPVATFRYPIEISLDVTDAPEMKEWGEKVIRVCERQYTMINDELKSDGFKPRTTIAMRLKSDYNGVAAAGGGRITGSVKFFKDHPDDIGAMVHETVHVVQSYRTRGNPGWLVEGIADYIRFYRFEQDKQKPPTPERARYNGSYRVTARFLNYVADKYDKELVRKLNKAMREGEYKPEIWKELTKKSVEELGDEWKESLKK
ncbi:MAG: basic secretory protein-like protein [Gemmataceae bacterium]